MTKWSSEEKIQLQGGVPIPQHRVGRERVHTNVSKMFTLNNIGRDFLPPFNGEMSCPISKFLKKLVKERRTDIVLLVI